MVAEGPLGTRRPEGQPHGHQREDQRPHIGEVVAGIGQQPGRVGHEAEPHLDDHQPGVEDQADGESSGSVHGSACDPAYRRAWPIACGDVHPAVEGARPGAAGGGLVGRAVPGRDGPAVRLASHRPAGPGGRGGGARRDPGQLRAKEAIALVRQGYAPVAVVSRGDVPEAPCPDPGPGVNVECFRADPLDTRGEAEYVGALAARPTLDHVDPGARAEPGHPGPAHLRAVYPGPAGGRSGGGPWPPPGLRHRLRVGCPGQGPDRAAVLLIAARLG